LVTGTTKDVVIKSYSFPNIEPTKLGLIIFKAVAPNSTGIYATSIFFNDKNGKRITNSFPIDGLVTRIDKMQVNSFLGKLFTLLKLK
jgi:hypothetical protein